MKKFYKTNSFKIKNFEIGKPGTVFVIAEIGINHSGNFKICQKFIRAAAKSGANAVKIQTVDVDESYAKNTTSYKEFSGKNFSDKELHKLKKISRKLGVIFFSTPGDFKSLIRLAKIGLPIIKISSGLMTNFPLIGEALKRRLPVIISTGLSDSRDLENLDRFLQKFKSRKVALLKCTSQYPADDMNLDLQSIVYLKKKFKYPIGYSDHSLGDIAPVVAVSCGATIIEKHITLNKLKKGGDHKVSLEPKEFKLMVDKIRRVQKMLGNEEFKLKSLFKKKRKKILRYLTAKKEIKKGDIFSHENISFMGQNKRNIGLEPQYFFFFKNKKSKIYLKKNSMLKKTHLKMHVG